MKEKLKELLDKIDKGEVMDIRIPYELLKIIGVETTDERNTLNDFIFDSCLISSDKRKLPLMMLAPNGTEFYPEIKMKFENFGSPMLGDKLEKMMITH
jgi:hypothetical protein